MVRRPLADRRLGRLPARLPRHDPAPPGAAHLCGQLVLPRLHPDHRRPPPRQQRRHPRLDLLVEVLHRLGGRAGRHGAVVVRPQRRRLLPHRRLPRPHVLLHPETGRPSGLFLPAVDRPFLVADLPLHLGRPAPPPLHGPARLGADPRHDLLGDAVDALLGRHDQRPDDPVGRLGQAPHRSGPAHDGGVGRLLRHVDLRRPDDVGEGGQLALPLHRLDHRPRPLRRPRLGRLHLLRRDLLPGAVAVEPQGSLLAPPGQLAFLDLEPRHRPLHHLDVGGGHPAGPDVARLHLARLPRILLHRDRRGDAPLLSDPRARRPSLPRRRRPHGRQRLADHRHAPKPNPVPAARPALVPAE